MKRHSSYTKNRINREQRIAVFNKKVRNLNDIFRKASSFLLSNISRSESHTGNPPSGIVPWQESFHEFFRARIVQWVKSCWPPVPRYVLWHVYRSKEMLFQRVSTQSVFFYSQRTYGLHQTSVAILPSHKAFSNDSSHSKRQRIDIL